MGLMTSCNKKVSLLYGKITSRLISFLMPCYTVAPIDRFNIKFAKHQFLKDLNLDFAAALALLASSSSQVANAQTVLQQGKPVGFVAPACFILLPLGLPAESAAWAVSGTKRPIPCHLFVGEPANVCLATALRNHSAGIRITILKERSPHF
jgi:hypothetical protein